MPFDGTRQLPGENIIVTTYSGEINAEIIRNGSAEVAKLMAQIDGPIYAVVDLSTIETSFGEVMKMLRDQSRGQEGTTTDPKLRAMALVGSNVMVKLYTEAMRRRQDDSIPPLPMYRSVEIAVEHMHEMIRGTADADQGKIAN